MDKHSARKIKPGDRVRCGGSVYTVAKVHEHHPDKNARVPMFEMSDGKIITYLLLTLASE